MMRRESLSMQTIFIGGNAFQIRGLSSPLSRAARSPTEPWLNASLSAALKCRPGAFLDVGVNLGQTFFKVLPILGKEREYLGFEPQIICCDLLRTFIEDNGLIHHRIFPFGLSNEDRRVKLYMRFEGGDDCASIVANFRPDSFYTCHQYISVRKGDDVLRELGTEVVSVIKVDVEGAELEVIEGLAETIIQKRPILIFEVLNNFLAVTGGILSPATIQLRHERLVRLENMLRASRYRIFNILPGHVLREIAVIKPRISADLSLTNYLGVPEEFCDSFDFPGSLVPLKPTRP
jgi:FkbM family methyltransferase